MLSKVSTGIVRKRYTLLGPVSVAAVMACCPELKKADFQNPLIDSSILGMKYLLGPVSVTAEMAWCPEPKKADFQKPLIDSSITGMKYLLGPVSVTAEMAWCPEPKKADFQKPLIDLSIKMQVREWLTLSPFHKVPALLYYF
jgi:hypothetical protein